MRILLATDGSASAGLAVDLVAGIPWPEGSTVRVVSVIATGAGPYGGPWLAVAVLQAESLARELRQTAENDVEEARSRLARPGLAVLTEVIQGRPATAIVNAAQAFDADVLVVGSRGHGTIGSMLLGSVSAEVIDHATVPVLVARGRTMNRVILAWDGSRCARAAGDLICAWPIFAASCVRVVSAADVEPPWWTGFPTESSPRLLPVYADAANAARREFDELTREMTARLTSAGLTTEADRRDGDAATELLAAASAWKADLIVMGTRGRTGLTRLVLGSVARNVVHHAPCSVLITRGPAGQQ
jgi:nucleotide-binding universal stress UspA family protein